MTSRILVMSTRMSSLPILGLAACRVGVRLCDVRHNKPTLVASEAKLVLQLPSHHIN